MLACWRNCCLTFSMSFSGIFIVSRKFLISLNSFSLLLVPSSVFLNCISSFYPSHPSSSFLFKAVSSSYRTSFPMLNVEFSLPSMNPLTTHTPEPIISSIQPSASSMPFLSSSLSTTLLLDNLLGPLCFVPGTCTNLKSNIRIAMIHLFITVLGYRSSLFNIPFMY